MVNCTSFKGSRSENGRHKIMKLKITVQRFNETIYERNFWIDVFLFYLVNQTVLFILNNKFPKD